MIWIKGERVRIGDLWDTPIGPVVIREFRRGKVILRERGAIRMSSLKEATFLLRQGRLVERGSGPLAPPPIIRPRRVGATLPLFPEEPKEAARRVMISRPAVGRWWLDELEERDDGLESWRVVRRGPMPIPSDLEHLPKLQWSPEAGVWVPQRSDAPGTGSDDQ